MTNEVKAVQMAISSLYKVGSDLATGKFISEPVMPNTAARYVRDRVANAIIKTSDASKDMAVLIRAAIDVLAPVCNSHDALRASHERLRTLVQRYASECGECGGQGEIGGFQMCGSSPNASSGYVSEPCTDCADIRAALAKAGEV